MFLSLLFIICFHFFFKRASVFLIVTIWLTTWFFFENVDASKLKLKSFCVIKKYTYTKDNIGIIFLNWFKNLKKDLILNL